MAKVDGTQTNIGHWKAFGSELWKRTLDPAGHPSFVFFFLVAIVGIGPVGVWIELFNWYSTSPPTNAEALRTAFVSFVPAFLAATCMQLIWAEGKNRSLRAFATFIFFISAIGSAFCNSKSLEIPQVIKLGAGLSALAMWTWWIANAKQKEFMDDPSSSYLDTVGGDVKSTLAGSDSLEGFKK